MNCTGLSAAEADDCYQQRSGRQTAAEGRRHQLHSIQSQIGIGLAGLLVGVAQVAAAQAPESKLAITEAGVEAAEDAPPVQSSYRFLPGDSVYFTFEVAGFRARSSGGDNPVRSIAIAYVLVAEDQHGVALAPPVEDQIAVELNPEDKNWSPKRRASLQLPSIVPAGTYHVKLTVRDQVAKTEVTQEYPFQIGGIAVAPGPLSVIQFHYQRSENDREPLELPAFAVGDTVFMRFVVAGFHTGAENEYHLRYSLEVTRPDGKNYLNKPLESEVEEKTFYPAAYLAGDLALTTSKSAVRGRYSLLLTISDLIGSAKRQYQSSFTIE